MDALCEWRAGKIGDAELQRRTWNACRANGISTKQPPPGLPKPADDTVSLAVGGVAR